MQKALEVEDDEDDEEGQQKMTFKKKKYRIGEEPVQNKPHPDVVQMETEISLPVEDQTCGPGQVAESAVFCEGA